MEQIQKQKSAQKVDLGEENSIYTYITLRLQLPEVVSGYLNSIRTGNVQKMSSDSMWSNSELLQRNTNKR